jgi:hypothetical protein
MNQCSFHFNQRTQCQNLTNTLFCTEHHTPVQTKKQIKTPKIGNSYVFKDSGNTYRGKIIGTKIVTKEEYEKLKHRTLVNPEIYTY